MNVASMGDEKSMHFSRKTRKKETSKKNYASIEK